MMDGRNKRAVLASNALPPFHIISCSGFSRYIALGYIGFGIERGGQYSVVVLYSILV
jgi:hypothetical protein